MLTLIYATLHSFFEKNLFERIIIYIFTSFLLTSMIFEFALGQSHYEQSQNPQWIFFGLLGLDYIISYKKIINLRITLNPISVFAFCLLVMTAHGVFVGVFNHNPPFVILNDTVPILMIALNILRMQSVSETSKPIDFTFIAKTAITMVGFIVFFSFMAGKTTVGSTPLFYPLFAAALVALRPFPLWLVPIGLVAVALTVEDTNRTTLMFMAIVGLGYIGVTSVYNPTKSVLLGITLILCLFTAWSALPDGSQTQLRILGLANIDLNKRTGSIGERQAERDAIAVKLEKAGTTTQWVGAGFGALYQVKFTHKYVKDYGHAHYSWAWFNLRFGKIGQFYLVLLLSALLFNGIRSFQQRTTVGIFVSFMCLIGLIYSFTHVNSILLLSGLHFVYLRKDQLITDQPTATPSS